MAEALPSSNGAVLGKPKSSLIRITGNKELMKMDEDLEVLQDEEITAGLTRIVQKAWEINRQAKERVEDEMLDALRQRNGIYDTQTLTSIREQGGSEIFMMLTSTKVRAAIAWIRDILMPAGDKPWGLTPTPIPELPDWANQAIAQRIAQTMPEGMSDDDVMGRASTMRDEVMKALDEIARKAAEGMEEKIEDQMAEGGWEDAFDEFVDDFCTFSAAFMKGPVLKNSRTLKWNMGISGEVSPDVQMEKRLEWERVSPFDMYPSPESSKINDGNLIERIRYTRAQIYNLKGLKGYSDENIEKVLDEYGRGGLRDWLWRDYERAQLEGKENWWLRADTNTIDGIHYWGSAQGLTLLEWGMDPKKIPDPLAEYHVDAILVGRHIIRAVVNNDPLKRRPYHKTSFQNIPGAFWGVSVPYLMRDHQRICNATARALSNNLGMASGPQIEVNVDRLPEGEVIEQPYPWKIWQTTNDKTGQSKPAINFFQPSSNAGELLAVFDAFEKKADDATNIPRYAYGNEKIGGAGNTASGLSMLMNAASKGIKLAIANVDKGAIKPNIEMAFTHNMLFDPDKTIKGDAKIIARGSNALLMKETQQIRRNEFLGMTNNPVDLQIMGPEGRAEILRETVKNLDVDHDKVVPPRDEFLARMKEQSQDEGPNPDMAKIELLKEQGQQKLDQDKAQHKERMDFEYERTDQQAEQVVEQNKDKLAMEERISQARMAEDRRKADEQMKLERYKARLSHLRDLKKIKNEVRAVERQDKQSSAVEAKAASAPVQQPAQNVIIHVDTKTGAVEKIIDVTGRDAGGKIKQAKMTEIPAEATT